MEHDASFPAASTETLICCFLCGSALGAVDMGISSSGPDTVAPGGNVVYTIAVRNSSEGAGDITLTDKLPTGTTFVSLAQTSGPAFTCSTPPAGATGTVTCSLGSLAAAARAAFSLTVFVRPQQPPGR